MKPCVKLTFFVRDNTWKSKLFSLNFPLVFNFFFNWSWIQLKRLQKMLSMIKTEIRSLFELIKGLKTIKQDWKTKTPLQKWYYLRNIGKIGFGLAGIPLFHDDQRLHLYSYFSCFYVGLYAALMIYTGWYYISQGEFMKCLPSTCLLIGPLIAVSSLFHTDSYSA